MSHYHANLVLASYVAWISGCGSISLFHVVVVFFLFIK